MTVRPQPFIIKAEFSFPVLHLTTRRQPHLFSFFGLIIVHMKSLILFVAVIVANIFIMSAASYRMPTPLVELLAPRGFRVSIPDAPGIELFAFHGNINHELEGVDAGDYSADVHRQRNDRWTYRNPTAPLNPGDTLYFWTIAHVDGRGIQKLHQQFHVPGDCPRVPDDVIDPQIGGNFGPTIIG